MTENTDQETPEHPVHGDENHGSKYHGEEQTTQELEGTRQSLHAAFDPCGCTHPVTDTMGDFEEK